MRKTLSIDPCCLLLLSLTHLSPIANLLNVNLIDQSLVGGLINQLPSAATATRPPGMYYLPVLHVDELGLTSDKYLELNDTVASLPLQLSL